MVRQDWVNEIRKNIVCVDSYDDGVLRGRLYNPYQDVECFSSLSQFLLKMESVLDTLQMPQAYTVPRRFSTLLQPESAAQVPAACRGARATFELKVLFRQNTSWQGTVSCLEKKTEAPFRSALELLWLMDSVLENAS